jgi:hypothetical protein
MSQVPADTAKSKPSASDRILSPNIDVNPGEAKTVMDKAEDNNKTAEYPKGAKAVAADDSETKRVSASGEYESAIEADEGAGEELDDGSRDDAPPLPEEDIPPLPQEPPPVEDDGWAPVWEETAQAFYFYNRFTGATQWTNPRVPEASQIMEAAPGLITTAITTTATQEDPTATPRPAGGYDPSIHGDYDPTAWYAQPPAPDPTDPTTLPANPADAYAATGSFNRFTGRWQAADLTPENHNDENKSKRQMNAFFDVDAAANSHDGRSLKAERSGKKLSKSELKQFKEKRKAKKEEKRRAWLRD